MQHYCSANRKLILKQKFLPRISNHPRHLHTYKAVHHWPAHIFLHSYTNTALHTLVEGTDQRKAQFRIFCLWNTANKHSWAAYCLWCRYLHSDSAGNTRPVRTSCRGSLVDTGIFLWRFLWYKRLRWDRWVLDNSGICCKDYVVLESANWQKIIVI